MKQNEEAPPRIELVIRVNAEGKIEVTGPIHNKMTCYGLLECARDVIKDHEDKATRSRIVQAGPVDPFLLRDPNAKRS